MTSRTVEAQRASGRPSSRGILDLLDIFVEPTAAVAEHVRHARWGLTLAMVVLFFGVAALSTYIILQETELVGGYVERAVSDASAELTRERLEHVRERTRAALDMPGMAIALSLARGASMTVHIAATWTVTACGIALAARGRGAFRQVLLAAGASLPIIILGLAVNLLLRLVFKDLNAVAGLLPLLGAGSGKSFALYVGSGVDAFMVWHLTVAVWGISRSIPMKIGKVWFLISAVWLTVLFCSFLMGQSAAWTM